VPSNIISGARLFSFVMRGLAPRIHEFLLFSAKTLHSRRMNGGWVYILTNRPNGTRSISV